MTDSSKPSAAMMGIPELVGPSCRIDIGVPQAEVGAVILVTIPGERICGTPVEFDVELNALIRLFILNFAKDEPEELQILAALFDKCANELRSAGNASFQDVGAD